MILVAVYGICLSLVEVWTKAGGARRGLQVNRFENRVNIDQITGLGVTCMSPERLENS
jgi:hypothetical protein